MTTTTPAYVELLPHTDSLAPDDDRDRWLHIRRQGIGSSDIAAILGFSTWASPYSVWVDKTTGLPPWEEGSEAMRWGLILEEPVAREWGRQNGVGIRRIGTIRSTTRPWQLSSPDFLCDCPGRVGVVEVKTDSGYARDEWDGTIPLRYQLQTMWQMDTLGADHGHLVVLLGGQELRHFDLAYDPEMVALMRDRAEQFWQLVQTGQAPDVDAHPATTDAIRARWGVDKGSTAVLDPEALRWADAIETDRAAVKTIEQRIDLNRNRLRDAMGPHTEAACVGQLIATNRPRKDGVRVLRVLAADERKDLTA